MIKLIGITTILFFCIGCNSENVEITSSPSQKSYFPPLSGTVWETKSLASLGWKQQAVSPLLDYLASKNTKAFIILVDGRIVMENYFNGHTATANWYWASAGKTLTATLTGIAQQENLININDPVSKYLGPGWTSAPAAKEILISCKNLLNMTSGIEDVANGNSVDPISLTYKADDGTRWGYHNIFVKLQDVIAQASAQSWNTYFNTKLRDKIGMNGFWFSSENNVVYNSTARSMARFGLLMLNNGKWENTTILNELYANESTTTSQNINLSYGYLWWLNGKKSFRLPQSQVTFQGSLIPSAPSDMFMALGKNDQKIYIIPGKRMVIIRMGDAADDVNLALSNFDTILWQKISALY